MAILFWEGGEGYQSTDVQAKLNSVGATAAANIISVAAVRTGAKGTRSLGASSIDSFYVTVSQSTIYVEFWWTYLSFAQTGDLLILKSASNTNHFRVSRTNSGGLAVLTFYDANNASVGSTTLYAANVWTHLGVKLTVGNTGTVTVKIDDNILLNNVSGDFQNGADTTVGRVFFDFNEAAGFYHRFDDIVIQDSSGALLGSAVHSVALFPSAAGDSTQWTPSAGSNFQCVDEVDPNDDVDYVSSAVTGQLDLYNITDLPSYSGSVLGVDIWSRIRKDSGATEQSKIALKTNAAVYYGSVFSTNAGYSVFRHQALVNPNTGIAWTQAQVNALQIGMEVA